MPVVPLRKGEVIDGALRRLKRAVDRAGVLTKLRKSRFFEKKSAKRKREMAAAVKRHQKKLQRESQFAEQVMQQQRREW